MVYARVPFIILARAHVRNRRVRPTDTRRRRRTRTARPSSARLVLAFSFLLCSRSRFPLSFLSVARCVNVPLFYVTLQNGFSTARPQHDNQKRARRTVNRFFDAIKRTSSRWLAREHPENSPLEFSNEITYGNRVSRKPSPSRGAYSWMFNFLS